MLTGKLIRTELALDYGLVNKVVEIEKLFVETETLVKETLSQAPIAVNLSWEAMHRGLNLTLEESAQLGADYFRLFASTDDFREVTSAFIAKKTPSYSGK